MASSRSMRRRSRSSVPYTDAATTFVTGPLVFRQNDKDFVAVGTKDGQLLLLDATTLAAPSAMKALTTAGAAFR